MNSRVIIALILAALSAIFGILALALPYWNQAGDSRAGLWRACGEVQPEVVICFDITWSDATSKLKAVRALLIISVFMGIFAFIAIIIRVFAKKGGNIYKPLSAVFCIVAGAFYLVSAIIYGTDDITKHDLSAAFGIDIVAGILGLAAGVGIFFIPVD